MKTVNEICNELYGNTYGVIYLWTNKTNGNKYVGQTVNFKKRTNKHFQSSFNKNSIDYELPLHRAIRKYGKECFEIKVIDYAMNYEELNEKEIYWIAFFNTFEGCGYNLTAGGGGLSGMKHKKETKEKISKSHKGKIKTKEHCKHISEAKKGKKNSKEHNKKISEKLKGRKLSEEACKNISEAKKGSKNPMYGMNGELNHRYGITGEKNPLSKKIKAFHFSKDGNHEFIGVFIGAFSFVEYAKKEFGIELQKPNISKVINGARKQYKGFYFERF